MQKGQALLLTMNISNVSKLQIDGRNAAKYDRQRLGQYPLLEIIGDIYENNMVYQLKMMYTSQSFKEKFNQILSTFKFL